MRSFEFFENIHQKISKPQPKLSKNEPRIAKGNIKLPPKEEEEEESGGKPFGFKNFFEFSIPIQRVEMFHTNIRFSSL